MSAWIQSGIAIVVAVISYFWMRNTQKREPSPDETRLAWMPIVLLFICFVCYVALEVYFGVQYALAFTAVVVVAAIVFRVFIVPRLHDKPKGIQKYVELGVEKSVPIKKSTKSAKRLRFLQKAIFLFSLWFAFGRILTAIYGSHTEELDVVLFPESVKVLGFSVSSSVVVIWGIMAVITILAILFRIFVVPRFRDKPHGLQNLVELSIEAIGKYTHGGLHMATEALACYMFTIVLLMLGSAMVELIGLRPPTADLLLTFSMALITFGMINYYSIKKKGLGGRLKSFTQPIPILLPIKILTDLAIPISLSCRLFGNMLGGMVVMDMLKMALGSHAIGIPSVAGLYFNVFHPLIQIYIFITLSLAFINEAVE